MNFELKLVDPVIPRGSHAKLLGLVIDEKLKNGTIMPCLYQRNCRKCMELCTWFEKKESLKTIYYSLIYSHLSYVIAYLFGVALGYALTFLNQLFLPRNDLYD